VDLTAFIESHVRGLRREPAAGPPHAVSCLAVEKVARQCVATRAGIRAGDLLCFVDGSPAARQSPRLCDRRARKRLLGFYSRAGRETVELATTGIEIGIELDYTAEAIRARFEPDDPDPKALERLWELGDCSALGELSRAALAARGGAGTPALLFEGVSLWEAGQHAAGLERMREYVDRYGRDWTMNFTAIALHYAGLEELRQGRKEAGLAGLRRAFDYDPLESTADAIAEVTGVRPPLETARWRGRPFPVAYALPTIEGARKTVGLADTLQAMGPRKLLAVCVLATYRSNGPYYDLLGRYHNFATFFAPFLAGMHAVTTVPQRYPDRPHHYEREDEVRALPLPFEVLLDTGEVTAAIAPSGSPFVLLVDAAGTIVSEGALESVDFWNALAG